MVTIFNHQNTGEVSSQNECEVTSRDLHTQFDENAFTRANVGRMHNRISITLTHRCQAASATRIIHCSAIVGHVRNAIFELYEYIGTCIDA
jgi:hypothetical protein